MTTSRISDWPTAFDAFIESKKLLPFSWGTHDCIMFATAVIEAITGNDPARTWRGQYATALGAARIFKKFGGFEEMICKVAADHGFQEQSLSLAQRGDLVLQNGKWPTAGVCCGKLSAFTDAKSLIFVPTQSCSKSWRIN